MELNPTITPTNVIAALLTLAPLLAAAFLPERAAGWVRRLPAWAQIASPAMLVLPYVLVACGGGVFRWGWFALYCLLPVAIAALLLQASQADPSRHPEPLAMEPGSGPASSPASSPGPSLAQRGNWRDFLILALLGLAVDLRWFEGAWPAHLSIFNKILLLDAGIYGFIGVRQLEGIGFDLRLRLRDAGVGLRELALYTPIALAMGLGLGFLHWHRIWPGFGSIAGGWIFTFFFIAVPEELFFRGWVQNLLERRIGRMPALLLTSVLFGLSHFNKRTAFFNWRYVLLAAVAGFFYGRAWRQDRRVGASAITHASVDTLWSLWFR
jgi:membrane protease YdiL (CAAX protease family)